ncbi:hypothetical protein EAI_07336 [Harpegnathos saltator]|uniref:Immunoglobulin-like beta-sandwich domain-containing protein n=2 Tax=Harpegnathos saltator TaxID=610380 RepID=E2BIC3_HARSA|nr:hypothetical protein EAI_07336 [Harpegnathos saltator]
MLPDHVNVYHVNGSNENMITKLHIERAKKTDSGEYTCSVSQFSTTAVHIHVLNGEKQAAVHHDQWNAARAVNHHAAFVEFYAVFVNLLLHLWRTYQPL